MARLAVLALAAALAPATAPCAGLFRPLAVPKAATPPPLALAPLAVQVDLEAVRAAAPGETLEMPLPTGRRASIRLTHTERHANGDVSWRGEVTGAGRAGLIASGTSGEAGTWAEVETPEGTWGLVPSKTGHDWLFDLTASQALLPLPRPDEDFVRPPLQGYLPRAKAVCAETPTLPAPLATLDVLAVVAPDFVAVHGGAAAAETRLNNIFSTVNGYYAASNVAIAFRRVGTLNANYQAASTAGDSDSVALSAMYDRTGVFANLGVLRDYFGADMVALFRGPKNPQETSISGIAFLTGNTTGDMPAFYSQVMYSVNGDWTRPGATLIAHEFGHNLGNGHERPNSDPQYGSTTYSFGHFVCGAGAGADCGQTGAPNAGTGFGTMMTYHNPKVARFSSPALTCQGTQAGALAAPCGVANLQDDVRSMNCVRGTIEAFKATWVGQCANLAQDTDRDGIPDCIEPNAGRLAGTKDNDVFASALLFSAQQYRDFLSREADADGLNHWMNGIQGATLTRGQMIESFFGSAEFQGVIAPVARLYFAFFLRTPDYVGLQYHVTRARSGIPLASIANEFAQSPEFAGRYGALSNAQYVTLVYQNVLGRAPDAGGLAFWKGQLDSAAMTRGQVMLGFSESAEYRAAIASEVYVTMMYAGMLRRAPDAGGLAFWVGHLDGGNSGLALINGFLGAPEYRLRFLP